MDASAASDIPHGTNQSHRGDQQYGDVPGC